MAEELFDNVINTDFHDAEYNTQLSLARTVTGGAIATATDAALSLWNSLPGTNEVNTSDVLRRISGDALQIYNENPDTIQGLSFVAGSLVPAGLAQKGMNAMRSGMKGVNWFTKAGKEADMLKVEQLFREGGAASSEYKSALRTMYAKGAANQALDAVATELAVVGAMNAHPLMEDYYQDPVKNFAIGIGLGSVVGGAIGHIADRYATRQLTGRIAQDAIDSTIGQLRNIAPDMTSGVALQSHEVNIQNLGAILAKGAEEGKLPTNDLAMSIAERTLLSEKNKQVLLFEDIVGPSIKEMPKEQRDFFMQTIIQKPEMFGVEKIDLLKPGKVVGSGGKKEALVEKPVLVEKEVDPVTGQAFDKNVKSVFYPEFGKFGIESDAKNYANASALGKTPEQLEASLPKNFGKVPNLDSSLEAVTKSSAEIHGEYVAAKLRLDKMSDADLEKLLIGNDDLPTMSAVLTRIKQDPQLVMKLKVSVSDRAPVYKTILENTTVTTTGAAGDLKAGLAGPRGVSTSYEQAVEKFTNNNAIKNYDLRFNTSAGARGQAVSQDLREILNDWVKGQQKTLNEIVLAGNARGYSAFGQNPKKVELFNELYESAASGQLRSQFRQIADADGYVMLYRGIKARQVIQQNVLESYSTYAAKAAEFAGGPTGQVRLVKIHVDNILGGLLDNAGASGGNEILVMAGALPAEATFSKDLKTVLSRRMEGLPDAVGTVTKTTTTSKTVAEGAKKLYASDIEEMLKLRKQELFETMLNQGLPLETISLKADIPLSTVEELAFAANRAEYFDMNDITKFIKTSSSDAAKESMSVQKTPLVLEGNIRKNPYTEAHAALDNKTMKDMNDLISMTTMYSSQSVTAQELASFFHEQMKLPLDILKQQLGAVNNEFAGTKLLNSTDFWARNMGSVGPIATAVGRQVQRITNDAIKRIVSPVSDAMSVVSKDAASTVEFNTFVNVNQSLSGWRQFSKDGKLYQRVERVTEDGNKVLTLEAVKVEGKDYVVQTKEVRDLILGMQDQGKELLNLTNTYKKLIGAADVNDIGLWIPSFNPAGKFIAYVHNAGEDTTKLLYANNKDQFADIVKSYKKYLVDNGQADKIRVITKDEQAEWNVLNGRLDTVNMERADVSLQKTGSAAAALVKSDLGVFSEIAGGYEHYITSQVRNLADANMSEITGMLDRMSVINQAITKNQPLGDLKKIVQQPKDAALTLRNTLLGNSNLGEYAGWQKINQSFETGLSFALNGVADVWNTVTSPLKGIFGKNSGLTPEKMQKLDYEKMAALLAEKGIHNPWANFDQEAAKMFGLSKIEDSKDTSKRVIYASNALAATVALRIGELAQPIVNILSLPILTGLATASKMPVEFMGVTRGTAKVGGVQIMYEGARAANSPLWKHLDEKWTKEGYYSPLVSEASNILRLSRSFEKGAVAKIENALDSNIVNIMSKPADWSESFVRRQTMFTGAVLAKRLYPELSDEGITIFARDFMDKAVGNFHASQRPVFFQGTLGVALGLFQTYMLTLGQQVYRQLEMKNYKALGKAALTQSGIFGVSSMPGFQQISTMIGDHFSDENVDLTTGTYRALGDKVADFVLYGLPSNLGPSFHTRGDVSIRPPNVLGGFQNTVAVSFASQALDMMNGVKTAMDSDAPDLGRAFGQALSMQSMSRPLARGAELATGYSVTRKGNTIQTPEEVWTATGIMARVLGTRPLEESKLREAMHLNTFYGSKDREARSEITSKLRTAIRGGELSQDQIEKFSSEYLRKGGTPTGWRSALNEAVARSTVGGDIALLDKLKPNNPLNYMINNLD